MRNKHLICLIGSSKLAIGIQLIDHSFIYSSSAFMSTNVKDDPIQ